jgi:hypothetical protein
MPFSYILPEKEKNIEKKCCRGVTFPSYPDECYDDGTNCCSAGRLTDDPNTHSSTFQPGHVNLHSATPLRTQVAQAIAREHLHAHYGAAHLLKGLLHNDVGLASQLAVWGNNIHQLRQWADIRVAQYSKMGRSTENPQGDEQVLKVLEVADIVRLKLSQETLSPLAVLIALCKPGWPSPKNN